MTAAAYRSIKRRLLPIALILALLATPAAAREGRAPLAEVPVFTADAVDRDLAKLQDAQDETLGLPLRFAVPQETRITPKTHGLWERIAEDTMIWRLRLVSRGAINLNLGFTHYFMPAGGSLRVHPAGDPQGGCVFTDADNKDHGELWTPVLETEDLVVEVVVPAKAVDELDLELTRVNPGYRAFGDILAKQGNCNVDVVCEEGDDWRDEIRTVAVYSFGGSRICTGVMMNNTSEDETPYFLTADHCGVTATSDASMVVYWNFQSPTCGDLGGGDLSDFQTGSTFLAGGDDSDYTLVLLDESPDPAWEVAYAGWDNSGTAPASAVAIHHPRGAVKCISFDNDPLTTTAYLQSPSPGDGTHFRVESWDLGTTEGGSSGSPLFDPDHRVVGQLHGGYASCTDDEPDWFGKLSVSWSGLGSYLDPLATGAGTLDTYAPYLSGLAVETGAYDLSGDVGGPFAPAQNVWTLGNAGDVALDFTVESDAAWLDIDTVSGTIPVGGEVDVTVSPNAAAAALPEGSYHATLIFVNTTSHQGDAARDVNLQVGDIEQIYSWSMETDPGWTTEGDWAWGAPQGGGGEYGNPDPTAGHTGTSVYGYALAGDYANEAPERHLTTPAIDCSALEAVTLSYYRWLNVERAVYDHAYLRISVDGTTWTTVWENTDAVTDEAWTLQTHDISALADGEATVYLRWTMGTTDGSWSYSGWNLDDVTIGALEKRAGGGFEVTRRPGAELLPNVPNPFNPVTTTAFTLAAPARVELAVYDLRGRCVRILEDGEFGAGRHETVWDGLDARGAALPSGGYLFRLRAGDETRIRKVLMVR